MHDKRCELFACPTLLAKPYLCVAEVGAWHVEPFRRPELVRHHVADHAHSKAHVDLQALVEFWHLPPGEPRE